MTPITREQARELAAKCGAYVAGNTVTSSISEQVAMLTDFRQQVIADLAREAVAMPIICAAGDFQEDVPVCTERSVREAVASLQAKLEQSEKDAARYRFLRDVPYTPELQCAMAFQANAKFDELIDAAMKKENLT